MSVLEMSLQASVMIVLIALARALAVNRLPKWCFQALWGIVVARLLVPMRVEFHLSAYNAVQQFGRKLPPALPLTTAPMAATPVRVSLTAAAASEPARAASSAAAPVLHISPWIIAWLIGAALLLTYFVITHLQWRKLYAQARTLSVARAGAFRGLRRVSIKVSNSIDAPLTYGVLNPVILMPEGLLNRPEYECALDHELIHVRHWDALKKWILMLALCVHWFNPLVWAMYVLFNRDMEMYCDDSLLRRMGGGRKTRYASMLLDLEEARPLSTPLTSHFGRNAIEERIGAIMRYRKTSILGVILALVLVVFTAAALATSAVTPTAEAAESLNSSRESAEASEDIQSEAEIFAHYAPFGLVYKADDDQIYNLYYKGEKVRYFEDTVHLPNGESPTYCSMSMDNSGSVDVRAVRDSSKRRVNPDGSFDPWEELVGLEPFAQVEFDARTAMYTAQREARETEGDAASSGLVEWWTAEGYEAWLNGQRVELPQMIGSQGWNQRDGWFTWTQEMVDERIALYERTLEDIKKGYLYSESVGGDGNVAIASSESYPNIFASAMATSAVTEAPLEINPVARAASPAPAAAPHETNPLDTTDSPVPAPTPEVLEDGWIRVPNRFSAEDIPPESYRLNDPGVSDILYRYRMAPLPLDIKALAERFFGEDVDKLALNASPGAFRKSTGKRTKGIAPGDSDIYAVSDDYAYQLYRDVDTGAVKLLKPDGILEVTGGDFDDPIVDYSRSVSDPDAREAVEAALGFLREACGMDTGLLTPVCIVKIPDQRGVQGFRIDFGYVLDGRQLLNVLNAPEYIFIIHVVDGEVTDLYGNLFRVESRSPVSPGDMPMDEASVLDIATRENHPPYGQPEICYCLDLSEDAMYATRSIWVLPQLDLTEEARCFGYEYRDGRTGERL